MKHRKLDYVYLRAWNRMMHSDADWHLDRAREEGAPEDAVYLNSMGRWVRFTEVNSGLTRQLIEDEVERLRT